MPQPANKVRSFCLKLYDEPLIYCIASGWTLQGGFRTCLAEAAGRPFHLLVVPYWDVKVLLDSLTTFADTVQAMSDRIRVHFMCPSEQDAALLAAKGHSTVHAHQNAFVDERVFRPRPGLPKRFRAIHNAALTPWKRHELAWDVERICVVTYKHSEQDDPGLLAGYRSLAWTNARPDGSVDYLPAEQVSELTCSANAGLVLSAQEGANFASGEYQFCGIPVVTTPSEGGRSHFLDGRSTVVVPPVREAVVQAVDFVERQQVDPQVVRQRALERAMPHRIRLLDWIGSLAGRNVHAEADARAWLPTFEDKLRRELWLPA